MVRCHDDSDGLGKDPALNDFVKPLETALVVWCSLPREQRSRRREDQALDAFKNVAARTVAEFPEVGSVEVIAVAGVDVAEECGGAGTTGRHEAGDTLEQPTIAAATELAKVGG